MAHKISAVILAAGKSSRMGDFKPLLPIGGVSAIKRLILSIHDADIQNIIVVTGYNRERLEVALDSGDPITDPAAAKLADIVFNPRYEEGMFTSIQSGIEKAFALGSESPDAVLLFPVDIPLVPSDIIRKLISASASAPDRFIVPCYEGKKGHPLVIPSSSVPEILTHDGKNGLKGITAKYDHSMIRMETGREEVVLDMDKPEDYKEILAFYKNADYKNPGNRGTNNLFEETGFKGRLFLVRHGSTRLHKEKIFMGQVDIPLSDVGMDEVCRGAEDLIDASPKTDMIYTSPLKRAKESAVIIRDAFLSEGYDKKIEENFNFMEMSLGDWDGRYIGEIKKEFPEEYKKRGQNFLAYKRSPDGENYYDLRYRVLKELRSLLSATGSGEDMILVTHKGVINVIRENILDLEPAEAVEYDPPKGSVTLIPGH